MHAFALLAKWPEVILLSKLDPAVNILAEKMWTLWNKIIKREFCSSFIIQFKMQNILNVYVKHYFTFLF